jgi:hypothetical protein
VILIPCSGEFHKNGEQGRIVQFLDDTGCGGHGFHRLSKDQQISCPSLTCNIEATNGYVSGFVVALEPEAIIAILQITAAATIV